MKGIFKNSDYFNFSMKVWMLLLLIVILPVTSAGIGINFESPSSSTQTILFGNLTNLSQMGDVSIGSPTDTHVLTYNSSLGKWTSQASVGGITWADIVNGTMMSQATFNTNYTANNDAWLNTTNNTYDAYNSSGLIKDWNVDGYIKDWNSTGYIKNWNATGLIINWSQDLSSYITWANAINGTLFTTALYNTNYTANDAAYRNTTNNTYDAYNSTGLIQDWNSTGLIINWSTDLSAYATLAEILGFNYYNSTNAPIYVNDTFADNYTEFLTHIGWDEAVNGTLMLIVDWDTNYTANNDAWLNTTNNTYDAYNSSGLIKDWNASELIINWSTDLSAYATLAEILEFGYYNETDFNISDYYTSSQIDGFSYYNSTNAPIYINDTFAANYSDYLTKISWAEVVNGTVMLQSTWNTNYTANNDKWLNTTNNTYHAFNSSGLIKDWNATGLIINWSTDLSGYVPYTGANQNIVLGDNNFSVNSSTLFVDSDGGNVGIGTASPDSKLEVVGDIQITDTSPALKFVDSTVDADPFNIQVNSNRLEVFSGDLRNIINFMGESDANAGNVGIGTESPGYKLEVLAVTTQLVLTHTDGVDETQFSVDSNGDLRIEPSGGDVVVDAYIRPTKIWHAYGGFQDQSETLDIGVETWTHVTNSGNDLWTGIESDGLTLVDDEMVITNAGDYTGSMSVTFEGGQSKDYIFRIYNVTQSAQAGYKIGATGQGNGNYTNVTVPIYLEANAGDTFQFQVYTADGTDADFINSIFELHYLHE